MVGKGQEECKQVRVKRMGKLDDSTFGIEEGERKYKKIKFLSG